VTKPYTGIFKMRSDETFVKEIHISGSVQELKRIPYNINRLVCSFHLCSNMFVEFQFNFKNDTSVFSLVIVKILVFDIVY